MAYQENNSGDEPKIRYHEIRDTAPKESYTFSDAPPKYSIRSVCIFFSTIAVFQIYTWLAPIDSTWKKFGLILLASFGMYLADLLRADFSLEKLSLLVSYIFMFDIGFIYLSVTSGLLIYTGEIHVLFIAFLVALFHFIISILFIKYMILVIILIGVISYFMRSIKLPISLASLLFESYYTFFRHNLKIPNIIGIIVLLTMFPEFFQLGPGAVITLVVYCILIGVISAF